MLTSSRTCATSRPLLLAATVLCHACVSVPIMSTKLSPGVQLPAALEIRMTVHRGGDDLLTAGLGVEGLRAAQAPALEQAEQPTPDELRRRAIHISWRGIADLRPGAFGSSYGSLQPVPGREWSAFLRLPGARHSHRALVQVPDSFDARQRCLVVTASSGSRGVYGAIAVAGGFGLSHGCAVAYTDKAAGSGVYDFDTQTGVRLDGTRARRGEAELEFAPSEAADAAFGASDSHAVAYKHAHSGEFPDADWGRHVLQAALFGLRALDLAFPEQAPFTAENTRILALGLSNGGGAVLRAAELDQDGLLDAVVAAAANITPPGGTGLPSLPSLIEYASIAALLQPCALAALPNAPRINPFLPDKAPARCKHLHALGWLKGATQAEQAADALAQLRAYGFRESTLLTSASNVELDLWRYVLATYLQSYAAAGVADPLCGYRFALLGPDGKPSASSAAQRALWGSDFSGLAPSSGIQLIDERSAHDDDPALAGLLCAYQSIHDPKADRQEKLRAAIMAVQAEPQRLRVPVILVHGTSDSLVPIEFTSEPYAEAARASGATLSLWRVQGAQHFDAFLAFPSYGQAYTALLPHVYHAMAAALEQLNNPSAWPGDRSIERDTDR